MKAVTSTFISLLIFLILMQVNADIKRDCRKQTGVSWASLKKLKVADFNQNDPKLKCYLKCFMQKNGIFGEDDIDIEKALRHLPTGIKGPSKTTLEYCKKIPSVDACDKAFQLAKCYFKAQPEVLKSVSFV
ncbi:general odorant-binding protein 56d-like isoform X1 [Microplitis mediator]|uniref:general odorant-binding protein 56d-like isoform X1 n=2 Tax=Microplitis mediator TaxID=375433 RepID=UPI002552DD13|nr:general odorant-binding protein 56d-like isoform X1 [Microplitis mediator]